MTYMIIKNKSHGPEGLSFKTFIMARNLVARLEDL